MLLYKYRSASSFLNLLDILLHERLYCAKYDTLNDPFEGQFMAVLQATDTTPRPDPATPFVSSGRTTSNPRLVYKDVGVVANGIPRICSLSSSPSEVRMWSLYAEGHEGVAIEIDFSGLMEDAKKVNYQKNLPHHGEAGSPNPAVILTTKTLQWDYEQEYRILLDAPGEDYFKVTGLIRKVLLGPRVKSNLKEMLIKVLPPSIPLFETELDFATGGVKISGKVGAV